MAIYKINDAALLEEGRYHISQPDTPRMSSDELKAFFDNVSREVVIPKLNEVIDGVNEALGLDGTGKEKTFVSPDINVSFIDGFYFNATAEQLTADGLYSSGAEYHLMDVELENGTVKPIYIRSNYSGSYSVHPDLWTWNTDILLGGALSTYVATTGYGKVKILSVSDIAKKYVSILPALNPAFKLASEQYVENLKPADAVESFEKIGDWYCKKWKSGVKECWCSVQRTYTSKEVDDGPTVAASVATVSLPTDFFSVAPIVQISAQGDSQRAPTPYITALSKSSVSIGVKTIRAGSGTAVISLTCIGE